MNEWWAALPGIAKFFYIVAIGSSFILVLQLLLALIGLGHEGSGLDAGTADVGEVDMGADALADAHLAEHDTGLGLLSVRTLMGFLVGFGWGGIAVYDWTHSAAGSIIAATAIGFGFMLLVFWLMGQVFKLRDYGNINYANAVGKVATVYISIPAKREGQGQVQVVVQGRLREVSAVSDEPERLAPGTKVIVTKMLDPTTFVVRKSGSE